MIEKHFKHFSVKDLSEAISAAELDLFGTAAKNTYWESEKLCLVKRGRSYRDNSPKQKTQAKKYIPAMRAVLRRLIHFNARTISLPSSADVIVVRNNVSLFYEEKDMRVKLLMNQGRRSLDDMRNEWKIREKIESLGFDFTPSVLAAKLDKYPYYFVDRLVIGERLNWGDYRSTQVLRQSIGDMWRLYRRAGISWRAPQAADIAKQTGVGDSARAGSVGSLEKFADRTLPVSMTHGDFSIGNIVLSGDKSYIVDWELAGPAPICRDLAKAIARKPELFGSIDALMNEEIEKLPPQNRIRAMTLAEQLEFVAGKRS